MQLNQADYELMVLRQQVHNLAAQQQHKEKEVEILLYGNVKGLL